MPWNRIPVRCPVSPLLVTAVLILLSRLLGQNASVPSAGQIQTPQAPASAAAQPGSAPLPLVPLPLLMIDPAHGGSDPGAVLNPTVLEKEVTLAIARRLRQELNARGIPAQLVRDNDNTLSADERATVVNVAHPALYLGIHATQGVGVRIYSALLPAGGDDRGPFREWDTAQSIALARSRSLQEQLAVAAQQQRLPVRTLGAPLRPLNNVTVPALAVEIAPATGNVAQLSSPDYQQMIAVALANAIAGTRAKWGPEL